jgi:predicted HAD superfamily phosphohydrolase
MLLQEDIMLSSYIDNENHIIEMTIADKITKDELVKVMEEIQGPLNEWDDFKVLKRIDSFSGMEVGAVVEDFNFAFENYSNLKKLKKAAVVTDKEWIENVTEFFSPIYPAEVKVFESEDIEEARSWLR